MLKRFTCNDVPLDVFQRFYNRISDREKEDLWLDVEIHYNLVNYSGSLQVDNTRGDEAKFKRALSIFGEELNK